ncbi:endo alpha-1,4 polygalactosaminidase [Rubrivivax albus]|uniref:Endo alpha-1,4 polygalactosaminidase n=1 Tax=Rubrivivax albus TaxID=2499835 RepID=A0A3S2U3K2_9BURK|nr:endo alpha-1,4 polygalactosaminidase [Rubrivivax albus]RVT52217.1 endo alpha-1,4 polygalactosaminidase [Rubrivivax albus]
MTPTRLRCATLGCLVALLAACGGGSGSGTDDDGQAVVLPNPVPGAVVPVADRWTPAVDDTWHWQLLGTLDTSVEADVYDVDLFDTPQATLDALRTQGRRVVCYFSAGSSEDWRPDFARFATADMGAPLDGWPGERWLDTRSSNVRAILADRLDLAVARGCQGVEPDNMDAWQNAPGFPLTAQTQLDFNRWIAAQARARGLAVGLKNDVDQLDALVDDFDFAVNEQCHEYDECGGYAVFTARGKPVFNAEYAARWVNDAGERARLCAAAQAMNLLTLVLPLDLDGSFRWSCDS